MPPYAPHTLADIESWAQSHGTTLLAARSAFVKFCVLNAVAVEPRLRRILILRGSGAQYINVATLEVLVAQKLYALAYAILTEAPKRREQDVFDLASPAVREANVDLRRTSQLLRMRAQREGLSFDSSLFDSKAREF